MASPRTSIFISHVNGDPDAEEVIKALVHGLKQELAPSHDTYAVAYDREIIAGKEWRKEIYGWLHDCAAAIILVSKQAFDVDKPWVSHEAFFLTVYKNRLRPDLCIIPVCLEGTKNLLQERKTFDPSDLMRFQALWYPGTSRLDTVERLVSVIAGRLRTELRARDTQPLLGLAAALHKKLTSFPESALRAAALFLDPHASWSEDKAELTEQLAKGFLDAEEVKTLQAFYALCKEARERRYWQLKQELALALGAERLREEYAVPIAVEAALPPAANCRRAFLVRSTERGIVDLYLTRAARRSPHGWQVLNVEPVLEFGKSVDLEKNVGKTLAAKLGVEAGPSQVAQFERARNTIPKLRKAGTPVLLKLDYSAYPDPGSTFHLICKICPELMVLYTASLKASAEPGLDYSGWVLSGVQDYDSLSRILGALQSYVRNTTPDEEARPS